MSNDKPMKVLVVEDDLTTLNALKNLAIDTLKASMVLEPGDGVDLTKQLDEQLATSGRTREQLWQATFDKMIATKDVHGVRIWFTRGNGQEVAILLSGWDIPDYINTETLIAFQALTRKERRVKIVRVMAKQYEANRKTKKR